MKKERMMKPSIYRALLKSTVRGPTIVTNPDKGSEDRRDDSVGKRACHTSLIT